PAARDAHLGEPDDAVRALERGERVDLPDAVVLRVRPEPGPALPVRKLAGPEPPLPALQRVPEGPDAVPDPAHRRARVRLLPFPPAAAAVEPGGAGEAGAPRSRRRSRRGQGAVRSRARRATNGGGALRGQPR